MADKVKSTETLTNLNLDVVRKKRFTIDGDENRILELNTSDLNLLVRLKEAYPKLSELANEAFGNLPDVDVKGADYDFATDESTNATIDILKDADKKMRDLIDYIFDSNVSEVCVPSGSMYDPINGKFRFEHIVECLAGLYESDISDEMNKISRRVRQHTDKYTRKK